MNLELWAQLNLLGHVSYSEYLAMTPDEAQGLYRALAAAVQKAKSEQQALAGFEAHAKRYENLTGPSTQFPSF